MNHDPREPIESPDYEAAALSIALIFIIVICGFAGAVLAIAAAAIGLVHHG